MTDVSLAGKTVLVTGGSAGYVKAMARSFVEAGASVLIAGSTKPKRNCLD